MENSICFKKINRSVLLASAVLVMGVAFTSTVHAYVVVNPAPRVGVYIGGAPSYHGYGYRHGYYGAAYGNRGAYNHGTAYRNGYRGNTAYHHGNGHGTVIHNGNVHHYRR